ncbi:hypothetical protein BGX26_012927 [Mortierella sp. AD094]|nr:hypothetical protein BGX26_012927 [Mortierella sp. AD094]
MASLSNSPITQVSQDSSPITQVSPAPAPSPSQYYIPSQHSYPTRLILDLRGTRFEIDRDTLIGLPESILVVMFPNGLILRPQTIRPGAANRGKAAASAMGAGTGASRGPLAAAGPGAGGGHHPSESTYTDYSDYSDYSYDDYDEDEDDYRDDPNGIHEEELDDDEQSEDYDEEEEEPQVIQVDFDPVCLQYILEFYREAHKASEAQRRLRMQEQQQMLQMQRQRLQQQQLLHLQQQQQQQQQRQQQKQKQSSEGSSSGDKDESEEVAGVATTTAAPTAAAEGVVGGQAGPSLPEPSSSQPVNLSSILPQNPLLNKQAIIVLREELDYFAIPPSSKANVHTFATTPESTPTTAAVIAPSTSTATTATVATTATAATTETTSTTATSSSNVPMSQARNTKLSSPQMIKTQCGRVLLEDRKIFAALQRNINKEKNQAEQHLMDMLCVSGFQRDGEWGYRRLEPKRTTVVSVAMVMLRTTAATPSSASSSSAAATAKLTATTALKVANALKGINSTTPGSGAQNNNSSTTIPSQTTDSSSNGNNGSPDVGKSTSAGPTIQEQNQIQMAIAQKLLLFWRKPARKCWWDGIEVEIDQDIDGTSGVKVPVRLWARRTWTLELILV